MVLKNVCYSTLLFTVGVSPWQVDTRQDGALLLELYSRDGVGCMISADFYEGIRPAAAGDMDAIAQLLKPLEDKGVLVHRAPEQLRAELPFFTVFEQVRVCFDCCCC